MSLHSIGWTERLEQAFTPFRARALAPARVVREERGRYQLLLHDRESAGELASTVAWPSVLFGRLSRRDE